MLDNLRPQYAKRFRCIGGACEDACCSGWAVTIDRSTYQKYESYATAVEGMLHRTFRKRGPSCARQSGRSSAMPLLFARQSLQHSQRLWRKLPFGNTQELPWDITKDRRLDRKAAGAVLSRGGTTRTVQAMFCKKLTALNSCIAQVPLLLHAYAQIAVEGNCQTPGKSFP